MAHRARRARCLPLRCLRAWPTYFATAGGASAHPRHQVDLVAAAVEAKAKLWGLAGIRAGYLLAPPDLAAALDRHRQPLSVNTPALAAPTYCAADATTPPAIATKVAANRRDLSKRLQLKPGVRVWPAAANFVLTHVDQGDRVAAYLAAEGVAVRPAGTFPGLTDNYLRLAVRTPAEHA